MMRNINPGGLCKYQENYKPRSPVLHKKTLCKLSPLYLLRSHHSSGLDQEIVLFFGSQSILT